MEAFGEATLRGEAQGHLGISMGVGEAVLVPGEPPVLGGRCCFEAGVATRSLGWSHAPGP